MSNIIQDSETDYSDPYDIELNHDVKYTWDTLLEMVCGTEYYSREELLYTYLKVNGLEEEAKHVLEGIAKELKQRQRKYIRRTERNKINENIKEEKRVFIAFEEDEE